MLPLYRTISAVYLVVLTKQENKTLFNRHIEQHYSLSWRDGTPDTKVQNFTNDNGGVGNATSITVNRPEWDKVKNVLLGNRPISDLGCE